MIFQKNKRVLDRQYLDKGGSTPRPSFIFGKVCMIFIFIFYQKKNKSVGGGSRDTGLGLTHPGRG